jgi:hypothetical protein
MPGWQKLRHGVLQAGILLGTLLRLKNASEGEAGDRRDRATNDFSSYPQPVAAMLSRHGYF